MAPQDSLVYQFGRQNNRAVVNVIALPGGRAVATVAGMDTDNIGVRFLSYANRPAAK